MENGNAISRVHPQNLLPIDHTHRSLDLLAHIVSCPSARGPDLRPTFIEELFMIPTKRSVITFGLLLIGLAGCKKSKVEESSVKVEEVLANLAGEWEVVEFDRSGVKTSLQAMQEISVTVQKDKLTLVEIKGARADSGPLNVREVSADEYTLQIDPAKAGEEINFAYASGDNVGQTRYSIYNIDGNKLKLCMAVPGEPRPTAFTTGKGVTVLVLERKP